jgi:hypothetical protein
MLFATPFFVQFFIHLTLQDSLQKALFFQLQKSQQICFFSLSKEWVNQRIEVGFVHGLNP